ncbi:hypothetical protein [Phaeospirillum tilakii]|uniref:Phage MuF C-terminal domain-containing protein n=1 Tax=Phaeospirillum tilakii TaxID=741673 RepID=A0ABW5CG66_9PROT
MSALSSPDDIANALSAERTNPLDPKDPAAYPGFFDEWWRGPDRGLNAGFHAFQNAMDQTVDVVALPVARGIDNALGTGIAPALEAETADAKRAALETNALGATTMGTGGSILKGVSKVLTEAVPGMAAGPFGVVATVGGSEGLGTYDEMVAHGVDDSTARKLGLATGAAAGLGTLMPVTWGLRGIVPNLTASAAANAGLGAAGRYANSTILAGAGYAGMAEQYRVWDGEALATDAILGAAFTGYHQWRVGRVEPSPAAVDDALAIREARHADTDTAPGLPATPEALAAHLDALAEIERAVVEGREPNFDGTGIHDVEFVRDPVREAQRAELAAAVAREIEPAPRPEVAPSPAEDGRRVAADIRDKLVAAGRSPEEAEAGGALWGAFFRTLGERGGFDAWESYRAVNLEVRRGEGDNIAISWEQASPFRRFDIARSEALFNRHLDAVLKNERGRNVLNLGRTPPVLQELGLSSADIALSKSVIDKAIASRNASSSTAGKHNTKIGPDHIADLVRAIADPIAVFADDSDRHGPGRVVVITDMDGKSGDPVAVVVGPRGQLGDGAGNMVPTIHERTHPMGPLLYVRSAEDIPRLPQSWTKSPGGTGSSGASAEPTVLTKADIVNKHGSVFYQLDGGPRANVSIIDGKTLVRLFETADASSFMHESAHIWLEMLNRAGETDRPGARALWDDVRAALGIKEGEAITREQHEAFAEGFEAYLRDGKAPTPALADVFARFKAWLRAVYEDLTRLGGPVPEGLRRVYDRMLATDAEIAAAHGADAGPQPLELLAAQQALAERPDLTIGIGDADAAPAREVLARHDAEIAQATELSRLIETAAACALRA